MYNTDINGVNFNAGRYYSNSVQNSSTSQDALSVFLKGKFSNSGMSGMSDISGLMMQMFQYQMMIKMFEKMGYDMGDLGGKNPPKSGNAETNKPSAEDKTSGSTSSTTTVDSNDIKTAKIYKVAEGGESLRELAKRKLDITAEDKNLTKDQEKSIKDEEMKLYGLNPKDIKAKLAGKEGAELEKALDTFKVDAGKKLLMDGKVKSADSETPTSGSDTEAAEQKLLKEGFHASKNGNFLKVNNNELEISVAEKNSKEELVSKFVLNKDTKKATVEIPGDEVEKIETKVEKAGNFSIKYKSKKTGIKYTRYFDTKGNPIQEKRETGSFYTEINREKVAKEKFKMEQLDTGKIIIGKNDEGKLLSEFRISDAKGQGNRVTYIKYKDDGVTKDKEYKGSIQKIDDGHKISYTNDKGNYVDIILDDKYVPQERTENLYGKGRDMDTIPLYTSKNLEGAPQYTFD